MIENTQEVIDTNTDSIPSTHSEKERLKQEIESHQTQTREKQNRLIRIDLEEWEPTGNEVLNLIKSSKRFPKTVTGDEKSSHFDKLLIELKNMFDISPIESTGNKIRKTTSEEKSTIRKLYEQGKSIPEISNEVRRTPETVKKVINET